jgi:para-nitrobenzyl esterase
MGAIVETGMGRLEGLEREGVRIFRGIPFARPPVGELRFRPPEPPQPWPGVRDATCFGPSAPQPPLAMAGFPGFDIGETSEDCLYLNVYAPAGEGARRPVLVWIHGGAFVIGSGSQSLYDGSALARRGDAIVVTVNYRLGALGFLDLGEQEGVATANAGLLDQVAALRFVRDHVEAFGGDPDNVTIFGESAGGMSVGTLLGCPTAAGLFRRAIAQSGACHATHDWESAAGVTAAVLSALDVDSPNVRTLREVPVAQLMSLQQRIGLRLMLAGGRQILPFAPVVDGHVLPKHPLDAVRDGLSRDVSLLIGTTRDEWKLFGRFDPEMRTLDEEKLVARVQQRLPHADGRRLVQSYRANRPEADWASVCFALETDRVFRMPAVRLAEAQAAAGASTFMYRFDWESPFFGGLVGACHGIDVPFVFGGLDLPMADQFVGTGPAARRLADRTMDGWLAFARGGRPGHDDLARWDPYDGEGRVTMLLGAECRAEADPEGVERALWDGVL